MVNQRIAPGGFEPPFSDPKSDVLPLDEGAKPRKVVERRVRLNTKGRYPVTWTGAAARAVAVVIDRKPGGMSSGIRLG